MKDGWSAVNNLDELANAITFCDVKRLDIDFDGRFL